MRGYLGIDVGSVSTNVVIIDDTGQQVLKSLYIRTNGQPIRAVQQGMKMVIHDIRDDIEILGVGTTGSARNLTGIMVGADVVKNEITAHAVAAAHIVPNAQTILEIGGQDSKIIILRNGIAVDFAMNTVCAAGTGSFLDQQASRLNIPIEEFGQLAMKAKTSVRIAGRCGVFAESDMVHKQQMGYNLEDIIAGLCEALVRNYLNNVGKGKEILEPIVFQGGVAANQGIKQAFERALDRQIIIPKHFDVMGAIGAALLAKQSVAVGKTKFKGFNIVELNYRASSMECKGCPNICEVINIHVENQLLARWGDRCGKWETSA
ncbi:MAG: 2-hydroxyglutaryl-CoA dehydratase [Clostridia bacterium]|jgi:predicted CoA-substrate-specific enzyme activase|nr:2-hydroxyglutaryl-CoA dehydratase [Clostridia bacterium]